MRTDYCCAGEKTNYLLAGGISGGAYSCFSGMIYSRFTTVNMILLEFQIVCPRKMAAGIVANVILTAIAVLVSDHLRSIYTWYTYLQVRTYCST